MNELKQAESEYFKSFLEYLELAQEVVTELKQEIAELEREINDEEVDEYVEDWKHRNIWLGSCDKRTS